MALQRVSAAVQEEIETEIDPKFEPVFRHRSKKK